MTHRKQFLRALFLIFLLSCLLTGLFGIARVPASAAPQRQVAANIVISEFRSRGPAGTNDEFVELYNPTNTTVDISGWTIRKSSSCGGTIVTLQTIPASTLLNPGQHYLSASLAYGGATSPDFRDTGNWGIADSGGVAVLDGSAVVIDQAGMCATTTYREGSPLAALAGTADQSYERLFAGAGNCQDTNNNAADFFLRNPSDPQNSSSPITTCGNPTATPTPTNSPTATGTATNTPTPVGFLSILINEVAWAGTAAFSSDEWIELYNPGSTPVNLAGWTLASTDTVPTINLSGVIPAGGYFLLERTDDTTVSDIAADLIYTGELTNSNESLRLTDPSGTLVDTANSNGGDWPAGSSSTFGSMERRAVIIDSDTAWITNDGTVSNGLDANGNPLDGTPKNANWAISVTATPSPIPSATRTPTRTRTPTLRPTDTRTPTPLPPPPLIAINEFVPRPGHDWNGDGLVNVGDEYIELLNHGVIDVNLGGYSLDDEVNIGSAPYRLPSITLSPGERIVFYGSVTGLLLSDGGDGVRLLKPNGQLGDAFNYRVVRYPDQSYCRYPDNGGADDWNENCFPTPGLRNSLSGIFARPPDRVEVPQCPISDTLPLDFVLAECPPFGDGIYNPAYWDATGWYGERPLPHIPGKWPVLAD